MHIVEIIGFYERVGVTIRKNQGSGNKRQENRERDEHLNKGLSAKNICFFCACHSKLIDQSGGVYFESDRGICVRLCNGKYARRGCQSLLYGKRHFRIAGKDKPGRKGVNDIGRLVSGCVILPLVQRIGRSAKVRSMRGIVDTGFGAFLLVSQVLNDFSFDGRKHFFILKKTVKSHCSGRKNNNNRGGDDEFNECETFVERCHASLLKQDKIWPGCHWGSVVKKRIPLFELLRYRVNRRYNRQRERSDHEPEKNQQDRFKNIGKIFRQVINRFLTKIR